MWFFNVVLYGYVKTAVPDPASCQAIPHSQHVFILVFYIFSLPFTCSPYIAKLQEPISPNSKKVVFLFLFCWKYLRSQNLRRVFFSDYKAKGLFGSLSLAILSLLAWPCSSSPTLLRSVCGMAAGLPVRLDVPCTFELESSPRRRETLRSSSSSSSSSILSSICFFASCTCGSALDERGVGSNAFSLATSGCFFVADV